MRSIEAEAAAQARRGLSRDVRTGKARVSVAKASAEKEARARAAVEAKERREADRVNRYWEQQKRAHHAHRLREIDRERRAKEAAAKRAAATEVREQRKAAVATQRARERTVGNIRAGAGRVARGTAGILGSGLRTIGGLAAIGGSIAAGSAISTQMSEGAMASTLANQAGTPNIKADLLREAQGIKGFTGAEALGALGGFVDLTGDLDTARKLLQELGDFALATGTSIEDAATAAGNFSNNLKGIKDPGQRAKAVMEAMRALGGQGAAGAVEIKDLAGGGATLGAVASQLAGDPLENIKKAGVLAQAARAEGGAASAAEALTAISRFTDMVAQNADKLEKLGVNVGKRDSKGNLTEIGDVRTLVADILEKTGGDLGAMNELLGIYGQKVTRGFSQAFKEEGRAGVFKRFDELMETELKGGDIAARRDSRLEDPDLQFKEAMKGFNRAMGEQLIPEVTKLIPVLAELTPHLITLTKGVIQVAEFFNNNPFLGIGLVVAGAITKELAGAYIGAKVSAALTAAIAGKTAATAAGTAAEVATGTAGAASKGVAGRAALGLAGATAGVAGGLLLGAYALSKPAMETMRENEALVGAGHFNASPYAAPGMIAPESLKRDSPDGIEAPREFKKIRDESAEKNDQAAEKMLSAADRMTAGLRDAIAAIGPAINRTNPMSKRPS